MSDNSGAVKNCDGLYYAGAGQIVTKIGFDEWTWLNLFDDEKKTNFSCFVDFVFFFSMHPPCKGGNPQLTC